MGKQFLGGRSNLLGRGLGGRPRRQGLPGGIFLEVDPLQLRFQQFPLVAKIPRPDDLLAEHAIELRFVEMKTLPCGFHRKDPESLLLVFFQGVFIWFTHFLDTAHRPRDDTPVKQP